MYAKTIYASALVALLATSASAAPIRARQGELLDELLASGEGVLGGGLSGVLDPQALASETPPSTVNTRKRQDDGGILGDPLTVLDNLLQPLRERQLEAVDGIFQTVGDVESGLPVIGDIKRRQTEALNGVLDDVLGGLNLNKRRQSDGDAVDGLTGELGGLKERDIVDADVDAALADVHVEVGRDEPSPTESLTGLFPPVESTVGGVLGLATGNVPDNAGVLTGIVKA